MTSSTDHRLAPRDSRRRSADLRSYLRLAISMVAAVSLGVAAAGYGGAAEAAETSSTAVVEIMTVPAVAGARFVFDNVTYRADRNGVVRLDIAKGTRRHTISVADVKINERTRDLAFVRWWYPGHHDQDYLKALTGIRIRKNLRIKAAFRATYLVHYSFTDEARSAVNRDRVSRLEFFGDNGHTVSGTGAGKIRLVGIRPVVNAGTILAKPVRYRVQRVDVDGSNVVQVNQQAFVPSQEASVVVPLLLRTAHFSTRDLLFGGPVGRSVRLTYPDGRRATVALNADGNATLEELARGRYSVSVDAAGYSFLRPVVLSRNQYIDLPVLTYLDIGVVGGAAAMLAGALYLFRLANRRSRVRAVPLVT